MLLPATLATGLLHSPKIYRVIVEQGQGPTYSVQFVANSADDIRNWRHQFRAEQDSQIRKMFGEKSIGILNCTERDCMTMPKTTESLPDRIILGIDPGTNYMGYGVVLIHQTLPKLLGMGVLISKGHRHLRQAETDFDRTTQVIKQFHPTEFAIEAQFFGKNVQSMLKLGRAQGVSIAAALEQGLPITEYAPLKIKQAITGNGMAAKEQVAAMVKQYLHLKEDEMPEHLDTTDAIGVALCHYFQTSHKINGEKKNSTTGTTSSNKTNKESKRAGKTAIPIQYFYTFAVPTPINFRTNPNNERKQQAGK